MANELDTSVIQTAIEEKDYEKVISEVRAAIAADAVAAVQDPVINQWLGRRYRNIFVQEALQHEETVKESQAPFPFSLVDRREEGEKVARRMFKQIDPEEIGEEMPEPQVGGMSETTLLFAPGLLTGLLPVLAFQSVWPKLVERFGINVLAVDSHPMRSCEENTEDMVNALEKGIGVAPDERGSFITEADNPTPPKDVVVIGYSKGSPDTLTLLKNRPDLAPRIKAFVGWAGAVGGSYSADDIYDKIKDRNEFDVVKDMHGKLGKMMLRLAPIIEVERINRRVDEYNIKGALECLTTWYRERFNEEHGQELAELGVPMFYFSGATTIFEVPWFQRQATWDLAKYDPLNDMQLTQAQTVPPLERTPHLAMFRANHWDLSYDTFPWYATLGSRHLKDPFAREPAMAAIVLFMSELGLFH